MSAPEHPAESPPAQPRGSLRLLVDPVFGPFVAVRLLSTGGVWIHNIVAAILAFELSGSALVVGLVSVAQFGPQLLFAPLSGALADRVNRRRQLVFGRLLVVAGSGALAVWIWLAGVDGLPGAWPLVAAAFVVGCGFVLTAPAQEALIPAMIRPGELAPAVALNAVPPTLARAGGPAVGALVAASLGPAVAFGIAAFANLLFVLVVFSLDVGAQPARNGADLSVRAALRFLRRDRRMMLVLAGIAGIGVGADPVITLTPPLAASLGPGAALVGVFASAFGVGSGVMFLFLGVVRRRVGLPRLSTIGLLFLATGLAGAGLIPLAGAVTVSLAVAGAGMTMSLTSFTTQLQERLPDDLRGRIMALWAVAFLGTRPIAAAVNGAVADLTSVTVALLLVALVVASLAWVSRPERSPA